MKLTIAIRDEIVERETELKYHDLILKAEKSFIEAVQAQAIKEHAPKEKIPQWLIDGNYINHTRSIRICHHDGQTISYGDGKNVEIYENIYVDQHTDNARVTMNKGTEKKRDKLRELKSNKKSFRDSVRNVVNSFNTDKQILEHIPEFSAYFPANQAFQLVPVEELEKVRKMLVKR